MLIFNAHGIRKTEEIEEGIIEPRYKLTDENIFITFTKTGEKIYLHHNNLIAYAFTNDYFKNKFEKIVNNLKRKKVSFEHLNNLQNVLFYQIINFGSIEILFRAAKVLIPLLENKDFKEEFLLEQKDLFEVKLPQENEINTSNIIDIVELIKIFLIKIWDICDENQKYDIVDLLENVSLKNSNYGLTYILIYILIVKSNRNLKIFMFRELPKLLKDKKNFAKMVFEEILDYNKNKSFFLNFCEKNNLEMKIYLKGMSMPNYHFDFHLFDNNKYQFNQIYKYGLQTLDDYLEGGIVKRYNYVTNPENLYCSDNEEEKEKEKVDANKTELLDVLKFSFEKSIFPKLSEINRKVNCDYTTSNFVVEFFTMRINNLMQRLKQKHIDNEIILFFACSGYDDVRIKPKFMRQVSEKFKKLELGDITQEEFYKPIEYEEEPEIPKTEVHKRRTEESLFADDIQDEGEEDDNIPDINPIRDGYQDYFYGENEEYGVYDEYDRYDEYDDYDWNFHGFSSFDFKMTMRLFKSIKIKNLFNKYIIDEETGKNIKMKIIKNIYIINYVDYYTEDELIASNDPIKRNFLEELNDKIMKKLDLTSDNIKEIEEPLHNYIIDLATLICTNLDDEDLHHLNPKSHQPYAENPTFYDEIVPDIEKFRKTRYIDLEDEYGRNMYEIDISKIIYNKMCEIVKIYQKYGSKYEVIKDVMILFNNLFSRITYLKLLHKFDSFMTKEILTDDEYNDLYLDFGDTSRYNYMKKYLKYKSKYLALKKSKGFTFHIQK